MILVFGRNRPDRRRAAIRGLKDASRIADVDAFLRAQYVAALAD